MIQFILTLLNWVAVAVCYWAGESGEIWLANAEYILLVVAVFLTLRTVIWLPFKHHQKVIAEKTAAEKLEIQRKQQMKDELTRWFRELGDRRRRLQFLGADSYERQCREDRGDMDTPGLTDSVAKCVKEHFGYSEYELFISDAGEPKIPADDPQRGFKAVVQFLERYEVRLKELIRKSFDKNLENTGEK